VLTFADPGVFVDFTVSAGILILMGTIWSKISKVTTCSIHQLVSQIKAFLLLLHVHILVELYLWNPERQKHPSKSHASTFLQSSLPAAEHIFLT